MAPGTYTIVVSVYEPISNQWGIFDNAIMHVIASPFANPPVAHAQALTSTVIGVGDQITFDATGSHAVAGSSLSYSWNFGDNTVVSGVKVTHQFKQAGRGFVTLTVTDARGARSIAQVSVVIIETAQAAKVTVSPTSGPIGTTFNFDASQTQPPADQPVAVAWDFGDGSPLVTTTTPTVAHTYKKPGNYTVTVGVYGQLGDGGVTTVKVAALAAGGSGTAAPGGGGGAPNWLLIGGGILLALLALAGGGLLWSNQRKRAAALRQRQMAAELARARRVNGGQPRRRQPYPGSRDGAPVGGRNGAGAQTRPERQPYPSGRDERLR
ncbi:MAG TPA: PKD domain-containing protein, partial [Ktedonobacterales bacterium]